jgi:hypothetical protein
MKFHSNLSSLTLLAPCAAVNQVKPDVMRWGIDMYKGSVDATGSRALMEQEQNQPILPTKRKLATN